MTTYPGSCHCGAVKIQFTSDKKPQEMRVGRCACSFCRGHGARHLGLGPAAEQRRHHGELAERDGGLNAQGNAAGGHENNSSPSPVK